DIEPAYIDWSEPEAIGNNTANSGAFTSLSASDNITLSNNIQSITHSGATSLTINSTSGFVGIETIQFSGFDIGISSDTDILNLGADFSVNVNADINGDIDISGTTTIHNGATIDGTVNINDILHLTPTSEPISPSEGDIYIGTDHHIYCYLYDTDLLTYIWKRLD
ncbi:MAG: hypothetical protein JXR51_10800, partial [Bacteroidales bacterium]|nr:hypothetical protein [Bacteroidales bacterium]